MKLVFLKTLKPPLKLKTRRMYNFFLKNPSKQLILWAIKQIIDQKQNKAYPKNYIDFR